MIGSGYFFLLVIFFAGAGVIATLGGLLLCLWKIGRWLVRPATKAGPKGEAS